MLRTIKSRIPITSKLFGRNRYPFGSNIQEFTSQELANAQKYVEDTLRNRSWVTYMFASYFPVPLRQPFYAIHLFDMELTKISENAREPPLGIYSFIKHWENSTSGKSVYTKSTTGRNLSQSLYPSVCITPSIPTLSPTAILPE